MCWSAERVHTDKITKPVTQLGNGAEVKTGEESSMFGVNVFDVKLFASVGLGKSCQTRSVLLRTLDPKNDTPFLRVGR